MKRIALILVLLLLSCTPKPKSLTASVSLINNGHSIKFNGLNLAVINEIARDSANWQSLIPVYRMPADTDLKDYQPVQPGTYSIKDSSIVFTPDTPFVVGKIYFLRYYQFAKDMDMQAFIRGRNRLNNIQYTDLIFKQ